MLQNFDDTKPFLCKFMLVIKRLQRFCNSISCLFGRRWIFEASYNLNQVASNLKRTHHYSVLCGRINCIATILYLEICADNNNQIFSIATFNIVEKQSLTLTIIIPDFFKITKCNIIPIQLDKGLIKINALGLDALKFPN